MAQQDDPLELEADRAAEAVVSGRNAPPLAASVLAPQMKCAECEEEERDEPRVQLKAAPGGPRPSSVSPAPSSSGRPLSPEMRAYFEPRFVANFAGVRVHTSADAAARAHALNARAFTLGHDITFGRGEFATHTRSGRHLIAHELAHVVQQRRSSGSSERPRVDGTGSLEDAAHAAANAVASGALSIPVKGASAVAPAAQPELGESAVDTELARVERQIADLRRQPTVEKALRAWQGIQAKKKKNRAEREGPRSPEVIKDLDREFEKLEDQRRQIERMLFGTTEEEMTRQVAVNFGLAPGIRQEMPRGLLLPTKAHVKEQLDKLEARRTELANTVEQRRAARRQAEEARTNVKPGSFEEHVEQSMAKAGVRGVRRPLTDFETKVSTTPNAVGAIGAGGARRDRVSPVYQQGSRDPIYYYYESNGYVEMFDIHGDFIKAGEAPLQVPLIDPIDFIPIGTLGKPFVAAGRLVGAAARQWTARVARKGRTLFAAASIGVEEVAPAAVRTGGRAVVTAETAAARQASAQADTIASQARASGARAATGTSAPAVTPTPTVPSQPSAVISRGARPAGGRSVTDPFTREAGEVTATAQTRRSMRTAIDASGAEFESFNEAVFRRGEIGLQAPGGANVRGADFITAHRRPDGLMEVIVSDATVNVRKVAKTAVPRTWMDEVVDATSTARLNLGNPQLEAEIVQAVRAGRVRVRTLFVDVRPEGRVNITGW